MKFRKTPNNHREIYTYTFLNGEKVTLRPDQDGVTEADIKCLHLEDDREVRNNNRNGKPSLTEQERVARQQWMAAHPGEEPPKNWHLSLDSLVSSDDGSSTADHFAGSEDKSSTLPYDADEPDVLRCLHELIRSMTERQQQVYHLVVLEGFNCSQAARILGISDTAVRRQYKVIVDRIRNDSAMQKFFC